MARVVWTLKPAEVQGKNQFAELCPLLVKGAAGHHHPDYVTVLMLDFQGVRVAQPS